MSYALNSGVRLLTSMAIFNNEISLYYSESFQKSLIYVIVLFCDDWPIDLLKTRCINHFYSLVTYIHTVPGL